VCVLVIKDKSGGRAAVRRAAKGERQVERERRVAGDRRKAGGSGREREQEERRGWKVVSVERESGEEEMGDRKAGGEARDER
jgi:hypothetical protein